MRGCISKGVDLLRQLKNAVSQISVEFSHLSSPALLTSFDMVSAGRSANKPSITMEAMIPPCECAISTTFVTVGSRRQALI